MSKRPPAPAVLFLAACATVVAAGACTSGKSPAPDSTAAAATPGAAPAPATFAVTAAQRARLHVFALADTTFRPTLEVTGTVAFNGDSSTQVLAPISGPVQRLLVNTGAMVQQGTPMAAVSSPDFASAVADYRKARDGSANTQRILKLDEQLYQNGALAGSDLDQARTDAAQAAADLDAATQALHALGVGDSTIAVLDTGGGGGSALSALIRSPIRGVVVERFITPGQLLSAGSTPAFTVAGLSTMWVMASVYPDDIPLVHVGERVTIYADASSRPLAGRVEYIAALVDPGTKATAVRIVADNGSRALRRDMFVRLQIHAREARTGLVIPASALLRDEDNLPFVFVQQPDSSFARRRITLGYRVGNGYEVPSGLAVGDRVLADGALFIQFAEGQ